MKTQIRFSAPTIRRIVRLYTEENVSTIKLAAEYGVVPATIARLLRLLGVKIKSRGRYPKAA